jgi:valyl-tRNA synthetase
VTGFDIIFLWVARMVIAGLEFMGEEKEKLDADDIERRIPFRDVYITGLIRDAKGRKMSKSLGNSPDPLDLIGRFGADGLRFGIVNIAPSGQDILFSEDRIEVGRHFCNKLWNAARFRQMNGEVLENSSMESVTGRLAGASLTVYDHWILSRLVAVTAEVERCFKRFEMHAYPHALYEFFWSDYCDWYVEASKSRLKDEGTRGVVLAVQDLVMRQFLLLLQPITPFIADELWTSLGYAREDGFLNDEAIPTADQLKEAIEKVAGPLNGAAAEEVAGVQELISRMRAMKAEYAVASRRDVSFFVLADATCRRVLSQHEETILSLAQVGALEYVDIRPDSMPAAVTGLGTVFLDVAKAIDVGAERERLGKELIKLEKGIQAGQAKLSNPRFVESAPDAVVSGARDQLAATRAKYDEIRKLLASLPPSD